MPELCTFLSLISQGLGGVFTLLEALMMGLNPPWSPSHALDGEMGISVKNHHSAFQVLFFSVEFVLLCFTSLPARGHSLFFTTSLEHWGRNISNQKISSSTLRLGGFWFFSLLLPPRFVWESQNLFAVVLLTKNSKNGWFWWLCFTWDGGEKQGCEEEWEGGEQGAAVAGTGPGLGHSQSLLLQEMRYRRDLFANYPGGKSAFASSLGWDHLCG